MNHGTCCLYCSRGLYNTSKFLFILEQSAMNKRDGCIPQDSSAPQDFIIDKTRTKLRTIPPKMDTLKRGKTCLSNTSTPKSSKERHDVSCKAQKNGVYKLKVLAYRSLFYLSFRRVLLKNKLSVSFSPLEFESTGNTSTCRRTWYRYLVHIIISVRWLALLLAYSNIANGYSRNSCCSFQTESCCV